MVASFILRTVKTTKVVGIATVVILSLFLLPSCQSETLYPEIISTYPDGMPLKVHYYEYNGNQKVKRKEVRLFTNGEEQGHIELNAKGQKHGLYLLKHDMGNNWIEEHYENGLRHGATTVWYMGGNVEYTGSYEHGLPHGEWLFYNTDGQKQKKVQYENGEKSSEKVY